ncbi:MAG: hypothetical protein EHM36_11110 [Deltaproteobacteria bacterium]|nr:MAG: hypothetical protein EHM36_11110 [Deltaproteobacteria bacterium]
MAKRKGAGEKMTAAQIEAEMPKKPKMPEPPRSAVGPVRKEYLINLPRGAYEIRLRAKNGTLVEESEKKVVAFTRRRQGGISYEVIPENMWTVKENCDDPSKVIYTIGGNTLFLRPFYADEYNELYYKKLLDPQNEGAAERWMWAHKGSIANIPIALLSKGKLLEKIKQAPYFVKQTPGSQLGYEIFPYKTDAFPGSSPTFEGYKVSFSPDKGNYEFRMEKDEKEIMEGSQRRITLIRKDRANFLYLVSFFPLLVGLAVFVRRRRSTS